MANEWASGIHGFDVLRSSGDNNEAVWGGTGSLEVATTNLPQIIIEYLNMTLKFRIFFCSKLYEHSNRVLRFFVFKILNFILRMKLTICPTKFVLTENLKPPIRLPDKKLVPRGRPDIASTLETDAPNLCMDRDTGTPKPENLLSFI